MKNDKNNVRQSRCNSDYIQLLSILSSIISRSRQRWHQLPPLKGDRLDIAAFKIWAFMTK
jgi:hypothetical protein